MSNLLFFLYLIVYGTREVRAPKWKEQITVFPKDYYYQAAVKNNEDREFYEAQSTTYKKTGPQRTTTKEDVSVFPHNAYYDYPDGTIVTEATPLKKVKAQFYYKKKKKQKNIKNTLRKKLQNTTRRIYFRQRSRTKKQTVIREGRTPTIMWIGSLTLTHKHNPWEGFQPQTLPLSDKYYDLHKQTNPPQIQWEQKEIYPLPSQWLEFQPRSHTPWQNSPILMSSSPKNSGTASKINWREKYTLVSSLRKRVSRNRIKLTGPRSRPRNRVTKSFLKVSRIQTETPIKKPWKEVNTLSHKPWTEEYSLFPRILSKSTEEIKLTRKIILEHQYQSKVYSPLSTPWNDEEQPSRLYDEVVDSPSLRFSEEVQTLLSQVPWAEGEHPSRISWAASRYPYRNPWGEVHHPSRRPFPREYWDEKRSPSKVPQLKWKSLEQGKEEKSPLRMSWKLTRPYRISPTQSSETHVSWKYQFPTRFHWKIEKDSTKVIWAKAVTPKLTSSKEVHNPSLKDSYMLTWNVSDMLFSVPSYINTTGSRTQFEEEPTLSFTVWEDINYPSLKVWPSSFTVWEEINYPPTLPPTHATWIKVYTPKSTQWTQLIPFSRKTLNDVQKPSSTLRQESLTSSYTLMKNILIHSHRPNLEIGIPSKIPYQEAKTPSHTVYKAMYAPPKQEDQNFSVIVWEKVLYPSNAIDEEENRKRAKLNAVQTSKSTSFPSNQTQIHYFKKSKEVTSYYIAPSTNKHTNSKKVKSTSRIRWEERNTASDTAKKQIQATYRSSIQTMYIQLRYPWAGLPGLSLPSTLSRKSLSHSSQSPSSSLRKDTKTSLKTLWRNMHVSLKEPWLYSLTSTNTLSSKKRWENLLLPSRIYDIDRHSYPSGFPYKERITSSKVTPSQILWNDMFRPSPNLWVTMLRPTPSRVPTQSVNSTDNPWLEVFGLTQPMRTRSRWTKRSKGMNNSTHPWHKREWSRGPTGPDSIYYNFYDDYYVSAQVGKINTYTGVGDNDLKCRVRHERIYDQEHPNTIIPVNNELYDSFFFDYLMHRVKKYSTWSAYVKVNPCFTTMKLFYGTTKILALFGTLAPVDLRNEDRSRREVTLYRKDYVVLTETPPIARAWEYINTESEALNSGTTDEDVPVFRGNDNKMDQTEYVVEDISTTIFSDNYTKGSLRQRISKCYVCGMNKKEIPDDECFRVFGDTNRHRQLHTRDWYEKPCFFSYGCFARSMDIGLVYDERGCRRYDGIQYGKSHASIRFAKLEKLLDGEFDRCITSPMASLTPFARGIYLWAHYTVCVCTKDLCNSIGSLQPEPIYKIIIIVIIVIFMC